MRTYNFAVMFIDEHRCDVVCRIRLNPRFEARDMIGSFPCNVTADFLNRVVATPGAAGYAFRASAGNTVEIVAEGNARALSDGERAILLNLMDFGQDFESERSTTIDSVEIPVGDHRSYTVEKLLRALESDTRAAIDSLDELIRQYPNENNEDFVGTWPSEDHDRYFYQIRLAIDETIELTAANEIESVLTALHDVNMWTGYNTEMTSYEIVRRGRTGISYEIEAEARSISYGVERPACNPALSVIWFWQLFERRLGRPTSNSTIMVTAED